MEREGKKKAEYRSSVRSKALIKEALLSLMIEKPFEKISISDVVRRADINRGTFYAHYSNTNDVLKSISASVVDEIALLISPYDPGRVLDSPENFLAQITLFLLRDPEYYAKLIQCDKFHEVLDEARYTAINKIVESYHQGLSESERRLLVLVLDYALSGVLTIYIDILLKKVPIKLEESVKYISLLLGPQREALSGLFSADTEIPGAE